ncbi:sorbosone dehydrogenase family protein [Bacillus xiapuensis]|uniref:Sorbosone dehydrogenase family protein n=1 Tax=Bacillus xiapuensis TaxID=2014075 RepID=A0ABU6N490_9BACI|nr:sorbosone dehydrogenase family protein [Bacillus xiapuensis]
MYKLFNFFFVMLLLSGCASFNEKTPKRNDTQADEVTVIQPEVEVVAKKLSIPWSIAKAGQTFYISERTGSIVKIENGQVERQRVRLRKPLARAAEAGLLGLVLDPQFSENHKAFAYYTYEDHGQYNRVIVLSQNGKQWTEERILLDKIPSAAYHHGGRLKIGPDGKLYITTGDATIPESAQNLQSLNGKILRMNLDGTIPSDNPFPGSLVYSYGHRNPQGLVWVQGQLYESEHGSTAHDEINLIQRGANYGWPLIFGWQKRAGMRTPIFQSGDETWAPSGMDTAGSKLYVAALRGNSVREYDLQRNTTKPVISGLGRIRDIYIDGEYLYFVSNNTDGRGNPVQNDDQFCRVRLGNLK